MRRYGKRRIQEICALEEEKSLILKENFSFCWKRISENVRND